jgi:hypothetical protein
LTAGRFASQLLAGPPAGDAEAVVERLLAVQAQDPRGFRLAVRARTRGLAAADVERALGARRLVVTWLNRGTLQLVRREDYPWLHALTTPQHATGNARRLAQEGVPPEAAERGVAAVVRALAEEGPLAREQLRDRVADAGVRTEAQALVHVLFLASLRGLVVRGPVAGKQHLFVLVRDWLGEQPRVDRERALAELGRRYLAGHAPADDRDLAKWAGITLGDARTALRGARPPRRRGDVPPPLLLGPYEELLLGWDSRDWVTAGHTDLVTVNGLFRSFLLVDGRAAGLWSYRARRVELAPFAPLEPAAEAALAAEAADVERFLG